jgi:hypothetical protein
MTDSDVTFGFHEFWPTTYAEFPHFWEIYPNLINSINSVAFAKYERTNRLQRVVVNLGILAATSLSEVSTLVGNGLGQGAMKIARSMLEVSINAEFLRQQPEHLDDYFDWMYVESHKFVKYLENYHPSLLAEYPTALPDQIKADFEAVKGRFGAAEGNNIRPGWCSVPLDARAAKTGFEEEYRLIYPMGNKLLHGTVGGMAMHAREDDDSGRVPPPPTLKYCQEALFGAHTCAVRVVKTVSEVMNRQPTPTHDVLTKDFEHAWLKKRREL